MFGAKDQTDKPMLKKQTDQTQNVKQIIKKQK